MIQIYLNDKLCDTSDNSIIAITLQLSNLAELEDRQSNFTNRFNLPPTKKNRAIIEHAQKTQSTTNLPYTILDARIYQNGVPIIQKGKATIQEISQKSIDINIFDGNVSFFDLIDDKSLNDLDLSSFDHTWDEPSATASSLNTYVDGYTYPVIDYGALPSSGNTFDINYQYPSVFVRTIIQQIFNDIGFTFDGLLFADDFFNSIAIPFTNEEFKNGSRFIEENLFLLSQVGSSDLDIFDSIPENTTKSATEVLVLDFASHTFINNANVKVRLRGDVLTNIILDGAGGSGQYFIRFKKNGVSFYSKDINNSGFTDIITNEESFLSSDILSVEVVLSYSLTSTAFNDSSIDATFNIVNGKIEPYNFDTTILQGGVVNLEAILPDISQKDFLKSIANMFGVIFNTNPITKNVTWVQYKELYYNRGKAIDWSKKVDIRNLDKVTKVGNYGQVNNLKYKEDENVSSGFGDGTILINDLTLDSEKDLFELEFAASESGFYFDFNLQCAKILKLSGSPIALETDTEPRIIYISQNLGGSPSDDLNFTDGSTSTVVSDYNIGKFLDTDLPNNLNFDINLKNNGYKELELFTLSKAQSIEVNIKLTSLDIQNINLTIPVYIAKENAYYYINKIKEFTGSETLTTVNLVKL